jgi:hypothetical protein
MSRKARARSSQANEDLAVASKSLARRRAWLIQPNVLSTTHRFGRTTKVLASLSVLVTMVTAIRLARRPTRTHNKRMTAAWDDDLLAGLVAAT